MAAGSVTSIWLGSSFKPMSYSKASWANGLFDLGKQRVVSSQKHRNLVFHQSVRSVALSSRIKQASRTSSIISLGMTKATFPLLRSSRLRVCCAAKPETLNRVMEIVKKQLALSDEVALTPESKFSALGADSLDTVEIVMGLEEEFGISVEEDNSQNITTVQEAADLIEKLVQLKYEAT